MKLRLLALSFFFGLLAFSSLQAQTLSCRERCDRVSQDCREPCRQEALSALQRCEQTGASTETCQASYDQTYSNCLSREESTITACKRSRGCSDCWACPDPRMGLWLGFHYYCECGNPYGACTDETPEEDNPGCGTRCDSPIFIDVAGDGSALTNAANGVRFDLNSDGAPELISWTVAGSDDAWLVLDRNGNGLIDNGKELFGNLTYQPDSGSRNGFLALAVFDSNRDELINAHDEVFQKLRLWRDKNHNGISEAEELTTLASAGITTLELDYQESKRTDEHGNEFRYRAKVRDSKGLKVGRWAWDVFLIRQ